MLGSENRVNLNLKRNFKSIEKTKGFSTPSGERPTEPTKLFGASNPNNSDGLSQLWQILAFTNA